jgi:two-component system response regulator
MMIAEQAVDILLVEDSREDAELAMAAMKSRNLGNRVVHLVNGDAALDFVLSATMAASWDAASAPRVILLDLKIEGMGGLEVLRQLKVEERTRRIPVVVITGTASEEEMAECYRLGVNSYVIKPAQPKQYAQVVSDIAHYWLAVNCPAQTK